MSYTKTEWACGDTITADKMNNIENGIEEALACCGGVVTAVIVAKKLM